jgi:hypothetical protein
VLFNFKKDFTSFLQITSFFHNVLRHTNSAVTFFIDQLWGMSEMNASASVRTDRSLIWHFEEAPHILHQAGTISNFQILQTA